MLDAAGARRLALAMLGAGSRRWQHSAAVASRAEGIAVRLGLHEPDQLVAAAWLHDIGYADALNKTGFHPLDGARYLQSRREEVLASFSAHHSCSDVEARHRGLTTELKTIPRPPQKLLDALTYCDMTCGPTGESLSFEQRLAEIVKRYGPDHLVTRSMTEARGELQAAIDRVVHAAYASDAAQTRSKLEA